MAYRDTTTPHDQDLPNLITYNLIPSREVDVTLLLVYTKPRLHGKLYLNKILL